MIKKIFLLIAVIIMFTQTKGFCTDFMSMCPVNPYKSNITPSKVTGLNWLTEKIAQGIIGKELKRETNGKFKVTMKSRGTLNLMNGKFNSLSMTGTNLNVEGVHLSKFSSRTVCDYNSVKLTKDNIYLRENMVLNYEMEIDNDALYNTLNENGYLDKLRNLNITFNNPLMNISLIKVNDANVVLKNNKIYYILKFVTPLTLKPVSITISSSLKVRNGRVQIDELTSGNNYVNTKVLYSLLEQTNPLQFTSDIMNNRNSEVLVDSAGIYNNVIHVKGLVLIPKNIEG